MITYFSYGSNALTERMLARCPGAVATGIAKAVGLELAFHKPSARKNGMRCGKATLIPKDGGFAWGVLYSVPELEFAGLCTMEKGYSVMEIDVNATTGPVAAAVHLADRLDPLLVPYTWYRDLVVAGMQQHNFPPEHIQRITSMLAVPDPAGDKYRDAREAMELLDRL